MQWKADIGAAVTHLAKPGVRWSETAPWVIQIVRIAAIWASKEIYGDIAQLGERLNGIQEAGGSSPLISILQKAASLGSGLICSLLHRCCVHRIIINDELFLPFIT